MEIPRSWDDAVSDWQGTDAAASATPDRHQRILDGLNDLITRAGYQKVSVQDIADSAGVGKGTVYRHWESKDAILDSLLYREAAACQHTYLAQLAKACQLVTIGTTAATFYRLAMSVPVLSAYNRGDLNVLGRHAPAPGRTDRLGISLASILTHPAYLDVLSRHDLIDEQLCSHAGRHALRAVITGFCVTTSPMTSGKDIDATGRLLAITLGRIGSTSATPDHAKLQAAQSQLLTLSHQNHGWPKDGSNRNQTPARRSA